MISENINYPIQCKILNICRTTDIKF